MEQIITAIKEAAMAASREIDTQCDWDSKAFFTGKREGFEEALAIIECYAKDKNAETIREALIELQELC